MSGDRVRLSLLATTAVLALGGCVQSGAAPASRPSAEIRFTEITNDIGLRSTPTWKYGGPTIADLDGDGDADFVLTNHHEAPTLMFETLADGTLREHGFPIHTADMHGIAAGDYDGDGDLDLLASLGGGNGLAPRPPILLRNDGWAFTDVTEQAGITLGARGRAVRWVDIDLDGDLDIIAINAVQVVDEAGPRHIVYENLGDATFTWRGASGIEQTEAERILLTDFNGDRVPDLVLFSPVSLWRGNGDFTFTDVTRTMLPLSLQGIEHATAVAEADIDNDGDFDLYVSRGKTYYEIANNSLDFDAETGRFDLRDEGSEGSDGLTFSAIGEITLTDFWHWKRVTEVPMPVYIGAAMQPVDEPAEPLTLSRDQAQGFPENFPHDGWYLGHLGGGEWRLEWHLSGNLAWGMRASVLGVTSVSPDFAPQNRGVADVLLVREGSRFTDGSARLPQESGDNNWGVTAGDFDNDGLNDLFVYRFGQLRQRIPDVLLHNQGTRFAANTAHGASSSQGHGDMGAAFDWDMDGRIDILSGDDNAGRWHMYRNSGDMRGNGAVMVEIGHSSGGTDAYGAVLRVIAGESVFTRRVGSNGATHSQSLLNRQTVGIGSAETVSVEVQWRDGTSQTLTDVAAGERVSVGRR